MRTSSPPTALTKCRWGWGWGSDSGWSGVWFATISDLSRMKVVVRWATPERPAASCRHTPPPRWGTATSPRCCWHCSQTPRARLLPQVDGIHRASVARLRRAGQWRKQTTENGQQKADHDLAGGKSLKWYLEGAIWYSGWTHFWIVFLCVSHEHKRLVRHGKVGCPLPPGPMEESCLLWARRQLEDKGMWRSKEARSQGASHLAPSNPPCGEAWGVLLPRPVSIPWSCCGSARNPPMRVRLSAFHFPLRLPSLRSWCLPEVCRQLHP